MLGVKGLVLQINQRSSLERAGWKSYTDVIPSFISISIEFTAKRRHVFCSLRTLRQKQTCLVFCFVSFSTRETQLFGIFLMGKYCVEVPLAPVCHGPSVANAKAVPVKSARQVVQVNFLKQPGPNIPFH